MLTTRTNSTTKLPLPSFQKSNKSSTLVETKVTSNSVMYFGNNPIDIDPTCPSEKQPGCIPGYTKREGFSYDPVADSRITFLIYFISGDESPKLFQMIDNFTRSNMVSLIGPGLTNVLQNHPHIPLNIGDFVRYPIQSCDSSINSVYRMTTEVALPIVDNTDPNDPVMLEFNKQALTPFYAGLNEFISESTPSCRRTLSPTSAPFARTPAGTIILVIFAISIFCCCIVYREGPIRKLIRWISQKCCSPNRGEPLLPFRESRQLNTFSEEEQ